MPLGLSNAQPSGPAASCRTCSTWRQAASCFLIRCRCPNACCALLPLSTGLVRHLLCRLGVPLPLPEPVLPAPRPQHGANRHHRLPPPAGFLPGAAWGLALHCLEPPWPPAAAFPHGPTPLRPRRHSQAGSLWSGAADKTRRHRPVLLLTFAASLVLRLSIAAVGRHGFAPLLAVVVATEAFAAPVTIIVDAGGWPAAAILHVRSLCVA